MNHTVLATIAQARKMTLRDLVLEATHEFPALATSGVVLDTVLSVVREKAATAPAEEVERLFRTGAVAFYTALNEENGPHPDEEACTCPVCDDVYFEEDFSCRCDAGPDRKLDTSRSDWLNAVLMAMEEVTSASRLQVLLDQEREAAEAEAEARGWEYLSLLQGEAA